MGMLHLLWNSMVIPKKNSSVLGYFKSFLLMNKILQQLTCQKKIRHQYTGFFSASRTGAPVCSRFQAAKALGDISTLRAASGTSELTAQFKSCSAGGRPSECGWEIQSYCWWFRNRAFTSWGKGSWNPIIYRGLGYIPGGWFGISSINRSTMEFWEWNFWSWSWPNQFIHQDWKV